MKKNKKSEGKEVINFRDRKCGMLYNLSVKHLISTGQTKTMDKYEIIDYLEYLRNNKLEKK